MTEYIISYINNTSFILICGIVQIIILFASLFYTIQNKRTIYKEIAGVIIPTIVIIASKNLLLVTSSMHISYILYSIFELGHLWLYLAFVIFVYATCGIKFKTAAFSFLVVLSAIDAAFFIFSFETSHQIFMKIETHTLEVAEAGSYYLIHQIVLGIFVLHMAEVLINRIRKVHYIYWPRYFFYLLIIFYSAYYDITGASDQKLFYRLGLVHFSIAFFAFLFSQVFNPVLFRTFEYVEALDSISQFFFLFDNDGVCMLANKAASEFFEVDPMEMSTVRDRVLSIVDIKKLRENENDEQQCIYVRDEIPKHLRLDYKRIFHKGVFCGETFGFTDITTELQEIAIQQKLARYDSFSGIFNRDWLFSCIERTLEENPDETYYVIGSDIRDFKVFNDVFGKQAGDTIIKKTAEALRELFNDGKIVHFGRIFGDRFGMLARKGDFKDSDIVSSFMDIDHPFTEEYYHLNIHFGVYRTNMEEGLTVSAMFDRAFVALDSIKNDVNVRIYHYNEIMRDEKVWEQTISSNIEKALKEGQLRIVVQPQVDVNENVIGGEALVRWRHPENGEISPGNFIPVLEKTGLVTTADIYVWEESCKLLRRWKDLGYEQYYISVNISPTDFIFADIYGIFTKLVEKYEISPKNLKLEITETAMMTDVLERIVLIKRLEEYGFSVELDDFGSGYSSLNMLKEIPVDVIKMDMKFLYNHNNESTANSRKVIGHIIHMAKDLKMDIVAEGVETKEQLEFLQGAGCDIFQGYYFSKPVEICDFEKTQGIA